MSDDRVLLLNMLRSQVLAMQCQLDTAMALIDAISSNSPFSVGRDVLGAPSTESLAEQAIPEAQGPVDERGVGAYTAPGLDLPKVFGGQAAGAPRVRPKDDSGGGDAPTTFAMPSAGEDGVIGDEDSSPSSPAQ